MSAAGPTREGFFHHTNVCYRRPTKVNKPAIMNLTEP